MTIQIPSGNATLTAAQVASLLIDPLAQASTFLAAGPTVIDSAAPVRIPRIASGATAAFVAAGAQIGQSNPSFDEVQLLSSTLKGIKVLAPYSNELLRQSVVALESVVRTQLVTDVATALDAALWDGTGTSDTIKGIFRQTGIQTGTLNLTDVDSLIDAIAVAQGNHVTPSHWVMTAESFAKLRKLKINDDSAQYLFDPSTVQNGTSFTILGLPVIITSAIPAVTTKNRVALVDFSKVVVARDVDAEVKILDQLLGDYDSVAIRAVSRWDVGLLQPKGVTLLTEA